jgi:hypothetical protein
MELDGRRIDAKEAIADAPPRGQMMGRGGGGGRGAPPYASRYAYAEDERRARDPRDSRRPPYDDDIKTNKVFVGYARARTACSSSGQVMRCEFVCAGNSRRR